MFIAIFFLFLFTFVLRSLLDVAETCNEESDFNDYDVPDDDSNNFNHGKIAACLNFCSKILLLVWCEFGISDYQTS